MAYRPVIEVHASCSPMRAHTLSIALCCALLLAGCGGGPFVIIPGGALSGSLVAAPEDWSTLSADDTVQVEFSPADPYSINIWGVGIGRDLYIATGDGGTRWTPMAEADPRVRARVGGALFELQAVAVTDAAERARVIAAYVRKYDVDPDDSWVHDGRIYRLDRRP
jgi:hypothetical protein